MPTRRLFCTACLCALASAQPQVAPERLDQQAQAYHRLGRFNGTVLIAINGRTLLSKGYGLANAEWDIPNTPQTKFRLGSITKQFTAMAVLLLEQQGKLKVSDPVCQYVDPCPAAWKPLTLHHLLTHTSGIPNFTSFPDYRRTMMIPSPPAETLNRFKDKPLDFEPGAKFSYSDSGYVLLGYIIEKASGESYASYVTRNILAPLGMSDTGYDNTSDLVVKRASGYEKSGGGLVNAPYLACDHPSCGRESLFDHARPDDVRRGAESWQTADA